MGPVPAPTIQKRSSESLSPSVFKGRVGRVQGTGGPREGCSVGSRPPLICALVLGQAQLRREQTLCAGPSRSLSVRTDAPRASLM